MRPNTERRLRRAVARRAECPEGGRTLTFCVYCGLMLSIDWKGDEPTFWTLRLDGNRWLHDSPAHLDHLIPESRNGPTSLDNTVISCPPCNMAKGDSAVGDPAFQLWAAARRRKRLLTPPLIAAEEAIYP